MPVSLLLALTFGCVGGVLIGIGLSRRRHSHRWQPAIGRIIPSATGLNVPSQYPRFEWRDAEGQLHVHESSMGSWRHYRKGDVVQVRYDPAFPRRAVIDSATQRGATLIWFGALLCTVAALFLMIELLLQ